MYERILSVYNFGSLTTTFTVFNQQETNYWQLSLARQLQTESPQSHPSPCQLLELIQKLQIHWRQLLLLQRRKRLSQTHERKWTKHSEKSGWNSGVRIIAIIVSTCINNHGVNHPSWGYCLQCETATHGTCYGSKRQHWKNVTFVSTVKNPSNVFYGKNNPSLVRIQVRDA